MKLLFFNPSTSLNVSDLSNDYSEKYVRVYSLKRIALIESRQKCTVNRSSQEIKLSNKRPINIKFFSNYCRKGYHKLSEPFYIIC